MSVLATDDFNRADGGVGANWTPLGPYGANEAQIVSNQVVESFGSRQAVFYNAVTWPDDQYSQFVIRQFQCWAIVRGVNAGGEGDFYFLGASTLSTGFNISKYTNNVGFAALDSGGTHTLSSAPVNGDVIRLEIEGTTLRGYLNGELKVTGTDNDFASGSPGFAVGNVGSDTLDDWEGGDIAVSVPRLTQIERRFRRGVMRGVMRGCVS